MPDNEKKLSRSLMELGMGSVMLSILAATGPGISAAIRKGSSSVVKSALPIGLGAGFSALGLQTLGHFFKPGPDQTKEKRVVCTLKEAISVIAFLEGLSLTAQFFMNVATHSSPCKDMADVVTDNFFGAFITIGIVSYLNSVHNNKLNASRSSQNQNNHSAYSPSAPRPGVG